MNFRPICMAAGVVWLCGAAISAADQKPAGDQAVEPLLKTFISELVDITPGEGKFPKSFQMGCETGDKSEQPVHKVTLGGPFSIAKYEVPQNLYEAVMGNNPSKWKGKRNSVEMMTHADAVLLCEKLTVLLRSHKLLAEHEIIRLPTEAEWEYCCRAGTTTAYSFGDKAQAEGDAGTKASLLDVYGWHTGNAAGNDPPVGAKKPNPWGLYDMHGYLWEFTLDAWSPDYEGATSDGSARQAAPAAARKQYVLRSGSWKNRYPDLRSSSRLAIAADHADDAVGIRCVKSSLPKSTKK